MSTGTFNNQLVKMLGVMRADQLKVGICDRPISLASSRFDQQYDRTNSCPPPFVALGLLDIGAIPVLGDNTL